MPKWLITCFLLGLFGLFESAIIDPCQRIGDKGAIRLASSDLKMLDGLCECDDLKELNLKKTSLVRIPLCLFENSNLKRVDLSKSLLREFPEEVPQGSMIEDLDLSNTRIGILPQSINQLKQLKRLNLSGTGIIELPDGLDHLDMRFIELNRSQQQALRGKYPGVSIFFSSPCNCG